MARKSGKEAKAERTTWFMLILVFMLLRFDRDVSIPDYVIPFVIATILVISGIYQYTQHWRVSPFIWVFTGVLYVAGFFDSFYGGLPIDLTLLSLILVVIIILMGVITNEG